MNDCSIIKVDNIELAFWAFVYYYRNLFNIPVIAVTGTCGKSTTKDMIMHILRDSVNVEGTDVSANSRTHNLSYLVRINESTDAAVFETAVGKPGDITNSCKYFKPAIGIITNISIDHLEGCKTMENYIAAKAELLSGVEDKGVLILNADDENIKKISLDNFKGRIVYFGIHNDADFQATNIEFGDKGMNFTLILKKMKYKIFVPGYGEHQVYNVLAALAAVRELGIGMKEAAKVLRSFQNLPYHAEVSPGINGSIIVDDTWNTNPSSLKAAIQVLNGIAKDRKKIALVGDINALGSSALEIHKEAGREIITSGNIDTLITIGPMTEEMGNEAKNSGFKGNFYSFPDVNGIYELLENSLDSKSILLIKSAGYHDKTIINLGKRLKAPYN
jgi:UDP-N-acetylmuramoyl-tripeptide--D-alanyl-D-alanine ligase